jgi:acetyltransferase
MEDGTMIAFRPILAEDEPLMADFHKTLSARSIYLRYCHAVKLSQCISHEALVRMCFIDYDRQIALVAERKSPSTGAREILGIGHLIKMHGRNEAEFALLVSDRYQARGIGTALLRRLLQIGQDERLSRITAEIMEDNLAMQRICEKLGFRLRHLPHGDGVSAEISL